ncbi:hypothetical protein ACM5Q9_09395 [Advenella sp. RU8]|uniref:hypothetical protein n=1 Tax=Advenella sp. RU8 TaxID=3399575 RepID=UPI003AACF767
MQDVVYLANLLSHESIPDGDNIALHNVFKQDMVLELQARHWPALFWWALFDDTHIQTARIGDDPEKTYPYLSAPTNEALRHWTHRLEALANILPEQWHPILKKFDVFLQEKMTGAFIILRTTQLSEIEQASGEDWRFMLRNRARDWQKLKEGMPLDKLAADSDLKFEIKGILEELQAPNVDPFMVLTGRAENLWPLPDLEALIRANQKKLLESLTRPSGESPEPEPASASPHEAATETTASPDPVADIPEQIPYTTGPKNTISVLRFIIILLIIFAAYFALT